MTDISLIVPCHNGEELVKPLIESLNKQKNKTNIKREVIFGIDNTTDNTIKVIKENLKNWDYKILIVNNSDTGDTRNDCLNAAEGKYIMFADCDDWFIGEDVFDELYRTITSKDYDIVEFKYRSHLSKEGAYADGTCWRAIFSKRIVGDTKFTHGDCEDNNFCEYVWKKIGFDNAGYGKLEYKPNDKWIRIDNTIYFYNYPRKGSKLDKRFNSWENFSKYILEE